jgi:hypothetical protein
MGSAPIGLTPSNFQMTYSFKVVFQRAIHSVKIAARRWAAFSNNFVSQRPKCEFKAVTTLNPAYVLAPFQSLITNCQNNVLMGLRIVEGVNELPRPTPEELQFLQLSFGAPSTDLEKNRSAFKRWVLLNGFQDITRSIRVGLERLFVFATTKATLQKNPDVQIDHLEKQLYAKAIRFHFPELIEEVSGLFDQPFQYLRHAESYNAARNCLQHTNGVVTERHCNNAQKDKIIIHGHRLKMFFKKDDQEVPAILNHSGPENAPLMLGAEQFQLEFSIGQAIELSLKQFLDVLNTCVFIEADIGSKIKSGGAYSFHVAYGIYDLKTNEQQKPEG